VTIAAGSLYTVVSVVAPGFRIGIVNPGYRVGLEVVGLCALTFAAIVMVLPEDRDATPVRDGLVAALVILALSNVAFGVGPAVFDGRFDIDRGLGLYPWVAARHLAGAWFLAAALGRPRLGLKLTLSWALLSLFVVESLLVLIGDRLPVPVVIDATGTAVEVVEPVAHVALQLVPGMLFALGAWLAARLHRTTGSAVSRWLALALSVQVFAQLHEILYPAMLGPLITSADLLRLVAFLLLLVGSLAQVRNLYRARSSTVRLQQRDLDHHADLVARLSRAQEQEEVFRSIVTHELATPIATIRNYADLIAAQLPAGRSAAVDQAVASMRREADALLELVGRIDELRWSDHEGFSCQLRPLRILPLLDDARRFVESLDAGRNVLVRCPDLRVLADPVRLGQLLRNVLVNAVRFAPPGTPIELHGSVDADGFELAVEDHGPGIPADERGLVLRRAGRGRNAIGTEGRGLGLYLAQQIAIGHGGSLHLGDRLGGQGTSVRIRLQVAT